MVEEIPAQEKKKAVVEADEAKTERERAPAEPRSTVLVKMLLDLSPPLTINNPPCGENPTPVVSLQRWQQKSPGVMELLLLRSPG